MTITSKADPLNADNALDDVRAMNAAEAHEYLFALLQTLKLTEKDISTLETEAAMWQNRIELAQSRGMDDLASAAEKEVVFRTEKLSILRKEELNLKQRIDFTRRKLPGLAARERSVDPDLLQQDLLFALGKTGEDAKTEEAFAKLEKESTAEAELKALKAKMDLR